jgi:hypothetical protein
MNTYSDTLAPGRIDLIIFPSGGKEVLGRQPSYPELPEEAYLSEVQKFVATKQGLEKPEKYTGYYTCKDNAVSMTWTSYAGPILAEESNETSE